MFISFSVSQSSLNKVAEQKNGLVTLPVNAGSYLKAVFSIYALTVQYH